MKTLIAILATAATVTAILLARDYQITGDRETLVIGTLCGGAMTLGMAHLLRRAWI